MRHPAVVTLIDFSVSRIGDFKKYFHIISIYSEASRRARAKSVTETPVAFQLWVRYTLEEIFFL